MDFPKDFPVGKNRTFECRTSSMSLYLSDVLSCQPNGKWSSALPLCVGKCRFGQ